MTHTLVLAHLQRSSEDNSINDGRAWSVAALILMAVIFIGLVAFWVLMFLNVLQNKKLGDTPQLLWGIALLFIPPLALLYYFVAYSRSKTK